MFKKSVLISICLFTLCIMFLPSLGHAIGWDPNEIIDVGPHSYPPSAEYEKALKIEDDIRIMSVIGTVATSVFCLMMGVIEFRLWKLKKDLEDIDTEGDASVLSDSIDGNIQDGLNCSKASSLSI